MVIIMCQCPKCNTVQKAGQSCPNCTCPISINPVERDKLREKLHPKGDKNGKNSKNIPDKE